MWNDGQPYLYQVPYADKGGSQTEKMPNQVDRDFSGASAWANVDLNAYDETSDLTITATVADQYCTLLVASAPTTIGKKYRMTFDCANLVSTWTIKNFTGTQTIGTVTANGTQTAIEWTATTTGGYRIVAVSTTSSADFDNFTLRQIGNVLDLPGEFAGSTSWVDKSGNNLNGVTSGLPVLTIPLPEYQYSVSQIFTTDIAASPKVLVIPAGYEVQSIYIQDMGTAGGLSGISATQETSAIALITGKAVATATGITFRTIADHNVYSVNKNLSFLATGNGSLGMRIVVTMKRAN